MYLGVNSRGKITQMSPAEKVFWRYVDLNGNTSDVFAFADRLGEGNNPRIVNGVETFPALSQNQMMPHSIRGKVTNDNEGPRYCVACHITQDAIDNYGAEYDAFLAAYNTQTLRISTSTCFRTYWSQPGQSLELAVLPTYGLWSRYGTLFFDDEGCPVNPLDANANRQNCNNQSPQDRFNNQVNNAYDLDRVVEANGVSNAANAHPMQDVNEPGQGFNQDRADRDETACQQDGRFSWTDDH